MKVLSNIKRVECRTGISHSTLFKIIKKEKYNNAAK